MPAVSMVVLVAVAGTLSVLLLPRILLLVLLIVVRSVADVGSYNPNGSLLPGSAISASVGLAAIFALLIPTGNRASRRATLGASLVATMVTFWTVITIVNFGYKFEYVGEIIRTTSLVAVLILAYRAGATDGRNAKRSFNWAVGLPALVVIVGYITNWAPSLIDTGRAAGTFSHPNAAAAFFTVGVIACLWSYRQLRSKISLCMALAGLVALLLTQSLGAIAALGIGGVVFFALNAKLSPWRRIGIILLGLSLFLTLFVLLGASGRLSEFQSLSYSGASDENSLDWRFANWQLLIPIWWKSAPLLGLGWASTRYEVQPMGTYPHSIVVQLLVEMGILGSTLVLVLTVVLGISIKRRYGRNPDTAAALAAIGVCIFVHGIESNWLNYSVAQYLALYVIGIMLGSSRLAGEDGGAVDRRQTPDAIANLAEMPTTTMRAANHHPPARRV